MHEEESGHSRSMKDNSIVRCKCGAEILLIPSVKQMDIAIVKHAQSHAEKEKNSEKAKAIFEEIEDYLVEQVLLLASEKK